MSQSFPEHRTALLALAGVALALLLLLALGTLGGGVEPADGIPGAGNTVGEGGEGGGLPPPVPPAAERSPSGGAVVTEGASPAEVAGDPARASRASELTAYDYGIRGRVRFHGGPPRHSQGDWWWPEMDGTIRAIDSSGTELSDTIDNQGAFELWELGPGTWVIVAELGDRGRAETTVQLTPAAPEALVELVPDRPVVVELRIRFPRPAAEAWRGLDVGTPIVAAHRGPAIDPRTSLSSLETVSTAEVPSRARFNDGTLAGTLYLPRDEELTLGLFVRERWIASRVRNRGQRRVEWDLEASEWPPASGKLVVTVLDDESGEPLDLTIGLRGRWVQPVEKTAPGVTTLQSVSAGWLEVFAGGGAHERVTRWVWIGPGESVEVTIRLHRGVQVGGVVVGPDGGPTRATLAAWRIDPGGGGADPATLRSCPTDRDGHFLFTGLRRGRYLIRSIDADQPFRDGDARVRPCASRFLEVEVLADVEDLRVELEPLATVVLARSPLASAPLTWHIEDPEGRWVRQGRLIDSAPFPVSLPVGSYRLVVEGGAEETRTWSLEVGTASQRIDL